MAAARKGKASSDLTGGSHLAEARLWAGGGGPSWTQGGITKHWAWGWKRRWGTWADRPSPLNFWQLPGGGRVMAERKEEEQRRLQGIKGCSHQGLVSPFLCQGQGGGDGRGLQWKLNCNDNRRWWWREPSLTCSYLSIFLPTASLHSIIYFQRFLPDSVMLL